MNGQRFQEARKKAGLTQQAIAEALGISVRTVTFWEAGERTPSIELLIKMADLLHVSTDYLLDHNLPPAYELPPPDDIAAHTDSAMTPEMKAEVEEIARKFLLKYLTNK